MLLNTANDPQKTKFFRNWTRFIIWTQLKIVKDLEFLFSFRYAYFGIAGNALLFEYIIH